MGNFGMPIIRVGATQKTTNSFTGYRRRNSKKSNNFDEWTHHEKLRRKEVGYTRRSI